MKSHTGAIPGKPVYPHFEAVLDYNPAHLAISVTVTSQTPEGRILYSTFRFEGEPTRRDVIKAIEYAVEELDEKARQAP